FASAKTTLRPVLSGVYLRAEKGNLILVSTDSYRLSEISLPSDSTKEDVSCIIPAKVLEELRSVLSSKKSDNKEKTLKDDENKEDETKKVEVSLSAQQIELKVGRTTLLSRLIDGKFPDYNQIIPKDTVTTAAIPTKEFVTAVKRMHYFAKEANNNLTFNFSDKNVHMNTPQTQAGQDEATLEIAINGKENKIALSSSYLLDFLGHIDAPEVEMRLIDSMHPAIFQVPGDEKFLHLIMPLRIQED
ncbi:MAG: DNA polymerase III subunit beta, partial [Candidatus Peribacteraceae bacterium]|nr:DNA polymerase III subunit beta [Candidatus Peribacteraceae bacterium]